MESSDSPRPATGHAQNEDDEDRPKPHKIFVTNLDVDIPTSKLEAKLTEKFEAYGNLDSVVAKKSYNNEYSFAFIEYKEGEDASLAVTELNNSYLEGKKMKVELQDNARRRKGGYQPGWTEVKQVGNLEEATTGTGTGTTGVPPTGDAPRAGMSVTGITDTGPAGTTVGVTAATADAGTRKRKDKKVKKHKSKHDRGERSSKHRRRHSSDYSRSRSS